MNHVDHKKENKIHSICLGCASQYFIDGLTNGDIPLGFEAERSAAATRWGVKLMSQEDIAEYTEEHRS